MGPFSTFRRGNVQENEGSGKSETDLENCVLNLFLPQDEKKKSLRITS